MRRMSFGAALAAVVAVSPLSAQTWQQITSVTPTGSGAYWRNQSGDNVGTANCNVGSILTNPGLTASSCNAQAPVYLPINTGLTTSSYFLGGTGGANPGGFSFSAGFYNIGLIGRISDLPTTDWGTIDLVTGAVKSWNAGQLSGAVTQSNAFAIWVQQALPAYSGSAPVYTSTMNLLGSGSTINQQFAVFSAGNTAALTNVGANQTRITTSIGQTYYVGIEDNVACGRGFDDAGCKVGPNSDRDYQDIIIRISAVPEPATVGLMGFGLLALAGVAKRRKA